MRLANLTEDTITVQAPEEDGWMPESCQVVPGNWLNIEPDAGEEPVMGRFIAACVKAGLTPQALPCATNFQTPG